MFKSILAVAACAPLLWTNPAQANEEAQCLTSRLKAKQRYEQCVQRWRTRGSNVSDHGQARLSRCREKYAAAWGKLQSLADSPTCGGQPRYLDNGNDTVTDNLTGLVWEQKTTDATEHHRSNSYDWSTSSDGDSSDEDGTVFRAFLSTGSR